MNILNKTLVCKGLIILVPTYMIAFFTEAMIYVLPMLAVTTILASTISENRVDEGDDGEEMDYSGEGE